VCTGVTRWPRTVLEDCGKIWTVLYLCTTYKKQLGLTIGQSEQATKSLLKRDGVKNLMEEQLKSLVRPRCMSHMRSCSFVWLTITEMESSSKIWRVQCYARKTLSQKCVQCVQTTNCMVKQLWWQVYSY